MPISSVLGRSRGILSRFLFISVLFSLVGAAVPHAQAQQGAAILNVALDSEPDTIDPHISSTIPAGIVARHVFDTLVTLAPDSSIHPGLAASWEITEDFTSFTFQLREDVRFHDGTELDASAVKFSFDRIVDPDTGSRGAVSLLAEYAGSEVLDRFRLRVNFNVPQPRFLQTAADPNLGIVSPTAVANSETTEFGRKPIGSGPFIVDDWVARSHITLRANPEYTWGPPFFENTGPPALDGLVFRFIQEPSTRLAALQTGEIDFIQANDVPVTELARLGDGSDLQVFRIPRSGGSFAMYLNTEKFPTNEIAVRKAIFHAVNREQLSRAVFAGQVEPAFSPWSNNLWSHNPGLAGIHAENPELAQQVLEEAGWIDSDGDGIREKDGQELTIVDVVRPYDVPVSEVIQAQLLRVGIRVVLEEVSRPEYVEQVARSAEHNIGSGARVAIDPDPGFRGVFHSSAIDTTGRNWTRFRSEEVDRLFEQAATLPNNAERREIYERIQEILIENAVIVPLFNPMNFFIASGDVENVAFEIDGTTPWFYPAELAQ